MLFIHMEWSSALQRKSFISDRAKTQNTPTSAAAHPRCPILPCVQPLLNQPFLTLLSPTEKGYSRFCKNRDQRGHDRVCLKSLNTGGRDRGRRTESSRPPRLQNKVKAIYDFKAKPCLKKQSTWPGSGGAHL